MLAESPPPSFSTQNRSNGASSHMGSHGGPPAAPPGSSGATTAPAPAARLGQSTSGSAVGGTSSGQEPTPMDMSLGPQPSQQIAAHGILHFACWRIREMTSPMVEGC